MTKVRDAATLILVRDGREGLQVLMLRRHAETQFAGGAYVFPGGTLDGIDRMEDKFCFGLTDARASALLSVPSGGIDYWIAAIRECFEEAGILLACDASGKMLDFRKESLADRLIEYRSKLQERRISLSEIARREDLLLATDRMHYWAHWVTPVGQPKRFDTRFFLALAPEGQGGEHDGTELIDSEWIRPETALERARLGQWKVVFPTMRTLKALSRYRSARDADEAARAAREIPTLQPIMVKENARTVFLLPGDEGYAEAAERFTRSSSPVDHVSCERAGE